MDKPIANITIVGGGTAGWLSACLIAARVDPAADHSITVTLIESPDIAAIGVGEGTWPTMRRTLARIGISETEFLLACDASFKQGTRFEGWRDGAVDDVYFHPFVPPVDIDPAILVTAWQQLDASRSFAEICSPQPTACALNLAPRQHAMPDYAGALNYAYHLDATKLAALLQRHATGKLGVRHLRDHVLTVERAVNGDIASVETRDNGKVGGDLFIDCTGQASRLLSDELGVPWIDRGDELFNDRALAVQVPVAADSTIASQTNAIAHSAGWIWDIGLPTRRGIGCVYSCRHASDDDAAATLTSYLRRNAPQAGEKLSFRRLTFRSGHRESFWVNNCLAIGLAAGFVEPLEASAIVMIEMSLDALLDNFPANRAVMDIHARRFNDLFRYRWDRIVDFLKLHYILSQRDESYWRDHRDPASVPARLTELLALWAHRPPSRTDFPMIDEVFPAASYHYVLYGMGFGVPAKAPILPSGEASLGSALKQVEQRTRSLTASLPTIRTYLDFLHDRERTVIEQVN